MFNYFVFGENFGGITGSSKKRSGKSRKISGYRKVRKKRKEEKRKRSKRLKGKGT